MKIIYTTGPKAVTMGAAGRFERGKAKDVADDLAKRLLEKKSIKFYPADKVPKEAGEAQQRLEKAEADAPENVKKQRKAKEAAAAKRKEG